VNECTSIVFTLLIYHRLACFAVASEKPTSTNFCTWNIVFFRQLRLYSHPPLQSALYQAQHSLRSWWIQTSNRREVTWTSKCSRCLQAWVIFISFPPNRGYVVCATNMHPVNQKLVEGFLLLLHDLTRGTSEAHLLLCGFLINIAHIHMWRQINH